MQTSTIDLTSSKILVSACLMGKPVRYDGQCASQGTEKLLHLQEQGCLVLLCPEVAGGLPTPRAPAERISERIKSQTGDDFTDAFIRGAEKALVMCQDHNIKIAILKENSPSCGSDFIYDGSFTGTKISGSGIVTDLLRANGVSVFSEHTIDLALKLANQ
ncbi:hypothetical protein WH95_08705 [Kiloniella litopenaei]|uniref:Uncharacterized protein n=2 Tax=Kiloniella litopenaei TaxID=1549748 RepID=A0A0M2RCJ5_9PROT|nr:DUF523 domain-containing protein [Kiloniella litopenaei]KKJ77308.1 hypothetical protein WH95_08705 [Kiloniella litopenaei]